RPRFGASGISIKLLGAFRYGIPVVTTLDGAWGLAITSGCEAFIESEPAAFATRVVDLLTSAQARAQMRSRAYSYLEEQHALSTAQTAVLAPGGLLVGRQARG